MLFRKDKRFGPFAEPLMIASTCLSKCYGTYLLLKPGFSEEKRTMRS